MNSPRFSDQTAIITGGVSGIGLAIARRLQAEGAFVVAFDRDEARFSEINAEFGSRGKCAALDVVDATAVQRAIESVAAERGRIDILINSAGVTGRTNLKSHEVDPADFDSVMAINIRGPFLTTKATIPFMLQRRYGRILHIASIAGKEGNAGMVAYSASKAALIGMTKVQGKEYAETGITINALAPAVIRTAMVEALPDVQVKYMTDKIPMKRCGTLKEAAAMAAFIVSPETSFTTGFTFDLTGGRTVY
jgi:NAD(P)-dependent dehydrogenase (short-subunit alcohol dehydrogenase family)